MKRNDQDTVNILIEALPYIREFRDQSMVIKYGGSAMVEDNLKLKVIQDIMLMKYIGIRPVIVHGGGNKISSLMKKLGKESVFIDGVRVTDKETVEITEMVLTGLINKELVSLLNLNGIPAVGLSGKDGVLLQTRKRDVVQKDNKTIDYGYVGEIVKVNTDLIEMLEKNGYVPVISPIGFGENGDSHNLNADTVAGHIAAALKAEKLIMLTDVEGVLDSQKKLIPVLNEAKMKELMKEGVISGGMVPKMEYAFHALENGCKKVHVIDGRIDHSILLELFTAAGVGTEITP
jgi:acetylglutamate kinase